MWQMVCLVGAHIAFFLKVGAHIANIIIYN